jgi:hypothetical protein
MRLEINIPDSTRPEIKAKISEFAESINERPELIEEIGFVGGDDAEIQRVFSEDVLAEIDVAVQELRSGKGLTLDQVRLEIAETRAQWLAKNPS